MLFLVRMVFSAYSRLCMVFANFLVTGNVSLDTITSSIPSLPHTVYDSSLESCVVLKD